MRTWKVLTNGEQKSIQYNGIQIYYDKIEKKDCYYRLYQDGKLVAKLQDWNDEIVGAEF